MISQVINKEGGGEEGEKNYLERKVKVTDKQVSTWKELLPWLSKLPEGELGGPGEGPVRATGSLVGNWLGVDTPPLFLISLA